MTINTNAHICQMPRQIFHLVLCSALIIGAAFGQSGKTPLQRLPFVLDQAKIESAIGKVQQGKFDLIDLEIIAQADVIATAPALKDQFIKSQDLDTRMKIAAALVRLGESDNIYWNFLVDQATAVVDSPDPKINDSQGNPIDVKPSPEYLEWARTHNLPLDPLYKLPVAITRLSETGDPRGIPLLRRGLSSHNYIVQTQAAEGLVFLKDKDSISLIIEACQRGPQLATMLLAAELLYFDDSRAQAAFEKYEPAEYAKFLRDVKAKGER